jgi:hypothetical protein
VHPGNAKLPIGGVHSAIQENGVPRVDVDAHLLFDIVFFAFLYVSDG